MTPGVWTTHDLKALREQKGKDFTVYILRDGRDVMVSYYFYLYRFLEEERRQQKARKTTLRGMLRRWVRPGERPQTPPTFLEFVCQRAPEWRDHVEQALSLEPDAVVKYEDLRQNPVATLQKVFARLGAPVEVSVIEAGVEAFRFEKLSGRKAGQEDPRSFFRKGIVGDWKNHFDEVAREAFESVAGDLLVRLGYGG